MNKVSVVRYSGIVTMFILMETAVVLKVFDLGDAYSFPMIFGRCVIYAILTFLFNKYINANLEVIQKLGDNDDWSGISYLIFGKKSKGKVNERNHD